MFKLKRIVQRMRQVIHIVQFIKSITLWIINKCRTRSIEEINDIYDNICKKCEHFDDDICTVCWCNIRRNTKKFNKLAFKNLTCPDNPPRWK
jgi:hypothetical protein